MFTDGVSSQVDKDDLFRALQRTRQMLSDFIRDEAHRSILIHNRAEGLTVWLAAPHGADISNSFSFTKKELKCDPKQSLPPGAPSPVTAHHSLAVPTHHCIGALFVCGGSVLMLNAWLALRLDRAMTRLIP
jgi:hypothetical protein